ncbi:MAG TPA: hypothetical protein VLL05_07805 [Terriglobales bacterium]|nr:hypothetical protein [Terriglobales bacterium]
MLKKNLLAVFGLLAVLAFATPQKANAQVAIGVTIGGPVYARPVYPYRYGYVAAPPVYTYRPYVYPRPINYGRVYDRPYWRHERFERHEYWEHRDRDRDRFRGDRFRR